MSKLDLRKIEKRFLDAQDSLVLQSSDLSLATIADMIENDAIDIDPNYQRRERWQKDKQSALIESFILNVPIPPIYLAEDDFGNYSVIDGKQRLTSIYLFMREELALTSLQNILEMEGAYFSQLPVSIQNALKIRPYLRVVTLLKQSNPKIKYEVFTRLNTGGEPLLPQEIRNVVYRGPMNDLVYELAENDFLRMQLKIRNKHSKPYRLMVDAEYVLRFFTLAEQWKQFSGNMRTSMDKFMQSHQQDDIDSIQRQKDKYMRSIHGCREIWGENAFKRYTNNQWRNLVLAGMYDAQMLGILLLNDDEYSNALAKKRDVVDGMLNSLRNNEEFENSVRQFTSNPERVRIRINEMKRILQSV